MLWHLFRPFSYLSIKHSQKWKVDWLYPLFFAVLSTGIIFVFRHFGTVPLYADGAFVSKILGFVQNLPGFYIAALAAIATFNKTDIDKTMPAPAPKIGIVVQGKSIAIELTRRRFLCSMFAFLTAESILLIFFGIFGQSIYSAAKQLVHPDKYIFLSLPYLFVFLFIFWQMLIASFWGLFYLGDRLHQPDP